MPYIKQEDRKYLDGHINEFLNNIYYIYHNDPVFTLGGLANYIITRILTDFLKHGENWNYAQLSQVIGTLECSKLEIYRRLVSTYEDKKISENGDLEEFTNK